MRGRPAWVLLLGLVLVGCAPAVRRSSPPAAAGAAASATEAAAAEAERAGAAATAARAAAAPASAQARAGGTVTTTSNPVRLHPSAPRSASAVAVHFVDALHGWAIAGCTAPQPCILLATTDGGHTWTQQYQTDAQLTQLQFLNGQVGFATGPKTILATGDGGARWLVRDSAAAPLQSVQFVTAATGWAIAGGRLMQSTDGGGRWTEVLATGTCSFSSLSFPDAAEGWAGGQGPGGPCLYGTSDGGKTWTVSFDDAQGTPVGTAIAAWAAATSQAPRSVAAGMRGGCPVQVDFTAPTTGWLSLVCYNPQYTGARVVLRSTDAGRSWHYVWGLAAALCPQIGSDQAQRALRGAETADPARGGRGAAWSAGPDDAVVCVLAS